MYIFLKTFVIIFLLQTLLFSYLLLSNGFIVFYLLKSVNPVTSYFTLLPPIKYLQSHTKNFIIRCNGLKFVILYMYFFLLNVPCTNKLDILLSKVILFKYCLYFVF